MSRTEQMTEFDERVAAEAEVDLDRLLSIDPSLEFVAKVRARIAEEPPARRWHWGRLLVPVAAAACLVLVVMQWYGRDDERLFPTTRQDDIILHNAKPGEMPAPVPVASVAVNRATVHRATAPTTREPEVIIDPTITDAIRRLALAARNTTLDGSKGESIAAPDSASQTLPIAEELNVPELVLKPTDQPGGQ